ncbi:Hypothetical protein PFR_J18_2259 [Propionibacterium freudenreichii]|nr:Hypothetical protein PFR_J18_2259 [Propionibacterium freudenreichii]
MASNAVGTSLATPPFTSGALPVMSVACRTRPVFALSADRSVIGLPLMVSAVSAGRADTVVNDDSPVWDRLSVASLSSPASGVTSARVLPDRSMVVAAVRFSTPVRFVIPLDAHFTVVSALSWSTVGDAVASRPAAEARQERSAASGTFAAPMTAAPTSWSTLPLNDLPPSPVDEVHVNEYVPDFG